jgi:hypothetical protein
MYTNSAQNMHVFSKMGRESIILQDLSQNTYYENFSKYMLTCKEMEEPSGQTITVYSYEDYLKNPDCISKSKLKDLKATAKHLSTKSWRVHIHGNKSELIERIHNHFNQVSRAIFIQKIFRGFLAKNAYKLRGPGYKTRTLCVNETDFFTMDPLNEIDHRHFYSYEDSKGFIYGFDVFSLMNLFKRERKIVNPYTREELPFANLCNIFSLYMKILLLHKDACQHKSLNIPKEISLRSREQHTPNPTTRVLYEVERRMSAIRAWPIQRRIEEVFMAIDNLGNYTQCRWFTDLSKHDYARFYTSYSNWWNRLPATTRDDICSCRSPFSNIMSRPIQEVEREEYQEACLYTIEYMVYSGKTIEFQKLGALQVLTHLTLVSYWARIALPWLFDSIEGVYGRYR